eukprot:scaffold323733_cov31-Tisochrysis_lutea.AAC.1
MAILASSRSARKQGVEPLARPPRTSAMLGRSARSYFISSRACLRRKALCRAMHAPSPGMCRLALKSVLSHPEH